MKNVRHLGFPTML